MTGIQAPRRTFSLLREKLKKVGMPKPRGVSEKIFMEERKLMESGILNRRGALTQNLRQKKVFD